MTNQITTNTSTFTYQELNKLDGNLIVLIIEGKFNNVKLPDKINTNTLAYLKTKNWDLFGYETNQYTLAKIHPKFNQLSESMMIDKNGNFLILEKYWKDTKYNIKSKIQFIEECYTMLFVLQHS